MTTYRADLHVHSRHSNKPSIWALRKFNCPESYTSPRTIYEKARNAGCDLVTITDHDTIDGALEIAHLPGTFVSVELTSAFPGNGAKIHVVALGVDEATFREAMSLRRNSHELVGFLRRRGIAHFLAHPLYDMDDRLTADTIEQAVLLFETFEVRNGARAPRFNRIVESVLDALTPETVARLAERHGIDPVGAAPWVKGRVGGSDDHGGFFIGRTRTVAPRGATPGEFLEAVLAKETAAEGEHGDALTLAHSIYGIGCRFLHERMGGGSRNGEAYPYLKILAGKAFGSGTPPLTVRDRLLLLIDRIFPREVRKLRPEPFEAVLEREARRIVTDLPFIESLDADSRNRKIFTVTSALINRLLFAFTDRMTGQSFPAEIVDMIRSAAAVGLVHLLAAPYYSAFHHQHRGKALSRELERRFLGGTAPKGCEKVALFTDTLDEINGVAITIRRLLESCRRQGIELVVVTSGTGETRFDAGVIHFRQVGEVALPEYPEMKVSFPPLLDVLDYIDREEFTRIHVSTPGSLGLTGLLVAKMMDLPVSGTYHTEIPQYVRRLTDDAFLENAAWDFMIWFYGMMSEVLVPSSSTRDQLVARGLDPALVRPLPRWVDTGVFTPAMRDPALRRKFGGDGETRFLYTGRVSAEKNLLLLADAFRDLIDSGASCRLIVVGDGPYRKEMEGALTGYPACFTGYLRGDELVAAYASCDVFVFPSGTDTFGNVVLEAQACGLPVIVSDRGGPQELVDAGKSGFITPEGNQAELVRAMRRFVENPSLATKMGRDARRFAESRRIDPVTSYSAILLPKSGAAGQAAGY